MDINPEWNAPPTLSGMAFFAPRAEAISTALAMPRWSPAMMICSGVFIVDSSTPDSRHISAAVTSSTPISAAIPPGLSSQAICINLPRSHTRLTASDMDNTPATTRAEYSPRLCPAVISGTATESVASSSALHVAIDAVSMAGCAFSVRVSSSFSPLNIMELRLRPKTSSTSWNTSRAAMEFMYRSLPMPTL